MNDMSIRTSVQREMQELEEYVSKQDKSFKTQNLSVNEMKGEQSIQLKNPPQNGFSETAATVDLSEEGKILAQNASGSRLSFINANAKEAATSDYRDEYESVLDDVSRGFKDAFSEQTIGKYVDSGIKMNNVDMDYVDALNSLYDKLREEIKTNYSGDELEYRRESLEKSYQDVFKKNIINPVVSQFESQISFYQHGALQHSRDKQLQESFDTLSSGHGLVQMLKNPSNWEDTKKITDGLQSLIGVIVDGTKSR